MANRGYANGPQCFHRPQKLKFSFVPSFSRLKIPVVGVRSTRHHALGGFRMGHASENVFKLSFLIDQPVALHIVFFGRTLRFI